MALCPVVQILMNSAASVRALRAGTPFTNCQTVKVNISGNPKHRDGNKMYPD